MVRVQPTIRAFRIGYMFDVWPAHTFTVVRVLHEIVERGYVDMVRASFLTFRDPDSH